jgi:hypothetical protein
VYTQDELTSIWIIISGDDEHASTCDKEAAAIAIAATIVTNNNIMQAFTIPTVTQYDDFDDEQHVAIFERIQREKPGWGPWRARHAK